MAELTPEEMKQQLLLHECLAKERAAADAKYAIKLIERIVLAACGLVLIAVVTALIAMVVSR
jgi:lipopolysaccharide/colanic/teichoic acid biosynthesis glycosyltransferase